jgi:hypothetical protein
MPEHDKAPHSMRDLIRSPVLNVGLFAFLLNFPWEFLQVPLYAGMEQASHGQGIVACARAALGDVVLAVLAYASVAAATKDRRWIVRPNGAQVAAFVAVPLLLTIVIENLATRGLWVTAWTYAASMPIVPGVGVGLAPLLQWVLLPPAILWLVRRQIRR